MARITYGVLIADIRGSVGGTTFSINPSGAFARGRVKPKATKTTKTQKQRALFSSLAQTYKLLSPSDVASWNDNHIAGLSGYQTFMKLNGTALKVALSPLSTYSPPEALTPVTVLSFDASFGISDIHVILDIAPSATQCFAIYITSPVSNGTQFNSKYLRLLKTVYNGSPSSLTLGSDYIAAFGFFPPVGSRLFLRIEVVSTSAFNTLTPTLDQCTVT